MLNCHIVRDREGNAKGTAFVEYESLRDLKGVIENYNGQPIAGRAVRIDVAREKAARDDRGSFSRGGSYRGRGGYQRGYDREGDERDAADSGFSSLDRSGSARERRTSERSESTGVPAPRARPEMSDAKAGIVEPTPESLAGRKKLQLAPRTVTTKPASPEQQVRSKVFGGARPREAVLAERGVDPTEAEGVKTDAVAEAIIANDESAKPNEIKTTTYKPPQSTKANGTPADATTSTTNTTTQKQRTSSQSSQPPADADDFQQIGGKPRHHSTNAAAREQSAAERASARYQKQQQDSKVELQATNAFDALEIDDQ